jgi:hypothetical protein
VALRCVIDTRDAVNPVPIVGDLIQAGGRVQARRDVIVGTNGNDNILADISNSDGLVDWIFAGMGDDIVQGGPGTGKTVVALHRAAYLLYTHRFPLEDQGVLVVGPNRLYLRYRRNWAR